MISGGQVCSDYLTLWSDVDPIPRSPPHFRLRLPTGQKPAVQSGPNFVDKWLNWSAPAVMQMTSRGSLNQPRSRAIHVTGVRRALPKGKAAVNGIGCDAYDNAMCESFFATLECELLERRRFASQAEAKMACFSFIEGWDNPVRLHSALGYRSPMAVRSPIMEVATTEP